MRHKKILLLCLLAGFSLWIFWENTALEVNTYHIQSSRLDPAFSGYRIAQVSDLHNAQFGKGNQKLLSLLEDCHPNSIVITGDLVDSRRTDISVAAAFAQSASQIAPCFYVTGNHESRLNPQEYGALQEALSNAGVTILHNQSITITRDGASITITGMAENAEQIPKAPETNAYHILLAHRPEDFEDYCQAGYDLVFSGHTHGGQIRLPLLGGILIPGQGLFPKYDAGLFVNSHSQMLISRGLGNSLFPLRIHNRPELILAELSSN